MKDRRKWFVLALLLSLALSLLMVTPAQAHGGEGDELQGAAGPWMDVLIYVQLLMIPAVGTWLAWEAPVVWRPRNHSRGLVSSGPGCRRRGRAGRRG